MSVYVEVVIFNNAALDLLTALLTLALRRKKARWWSLALSVALGAAVGTAYPLFPAPAKICAAVLLPLVMTAGFHKFASFADYVVSLGVFLMLTFATGGAVLAAVAISGVELRGYSVLGFVALGAAAAVAGVRAALASSGKISRPVVKAAIGLKSGVRRVSALADTGNTLTDCASGLPVVIASGEVSERLRAEGEGVCGFVEAKTPLGTGTLPIVGPLRVEVGGRECKAFAALTESSFDGYELILQNTMFGGEKGRKI